MSRLLRNSLTIDTADVDERDPAVVAPGGLYWRSGRQSSYNLPRKTSSSTAFSLTEQLFCHPIAGINSIEPTISSSLVPAITICSGDQPPRLYLTTWFAGCILTILTSQQAAADILRSPFSALWYLQPY